VATFSPAESRPANGPGLEGPELEGAGRTDARLDGPGRTGTIQSGPTSAASGKKGSFGQRLIRELTDQLGGEMSLTTRQGTYFRLWIPTPV
jgi:hypothetical protein